MRLHLGMSERKVGRTDRRETSTPLSAARARLLTSTITTAPAAASGLARMCLLRLSAVECCCRRPEFGGKLWRVQRGPAEGRRDVCRIVARKAHTVLEPKDRFVESVANGRVQQVALHIPKRFDLVAELAHAAQGSVSGAERT